MMMLTRIMVSTTTILTAVAAILCIASFATAAPAATHNFGDAYSKYQDNRNVAQQQDEDVLQLEHLKKPHLDATEQQLLASELLPELERQLQMSADLASQRERQQQQQQQESVPQIPQLLSPLLPVVVSNMGQREDEEQLIVQHEGGTSIITHDDEQPKEIEPELMGVDANAGGLDNTNNPLLKSFHGAARLTYGQNPEPVVSNNQIPSSSSSSTATPSTIQQPEQLQTTTANTQADDDVLEETPSSASEITNNGEKRSTSNNDLSSKPNLKSPEMLLIRHSGGQVSSLDMAQYVFWTGDEEGVARAVEEFIQKGLMSRESAIKLLREISMGIEYLENSYANRVMQNDQMSAGAHNNYPSMEQQQTGAGILATTTTTRRPAIAKGSSNIIINSPVTTAITGSVSSNGGGPGTTTTTPKPMPSEKFYQTKQILSTAAIQKAIQQLPSYFKFNEISKKNNNENKENSIGYEEIEDKVRLADCLYAAYSLEETIYQLAKVMFYQSLTTGSHHAQVALQRLTAFLESESANGRVPPSLQKRILDVLLAALSDCLTEHPDLLPAARDGLGAALDQLPKHRPAVQQNLIK